MYASRPCYTDTIYIIHQGENFIASGLQIYTSPLLELLLYTLTTPLAQDYPFKLTPLNRKYTSFTPDKKISYRFTHYYFCL